MCASCVPYGIRHPAYLTLAFDPGEAAQVDWDLAQLTEGEIALLADQTIARRIRAARFPMIKTLDPFHWDWPKRINRLQIQDLFRLQFVHDKANIILMGSVGRRNRNEVRVRCF